LAALLAALGACSAALSKEEIDRYEGFAGDGASATQYLQAQKLLAAGEPQQALAIAKPLVERFPRNVFVHRLYQDAKIGVGERALLLAEYEELVKTSPSALSYTLLSRIQTDPEKGAFLVRQAYELDDRFPWAWYGYGWWNGKLGNEPQRAEAALQRALDLNPDFLTALRAYAVVLRDRDRKSAADAIARYVDRYPDRREDRLLLASLRLSLGGSEVELAEADYRKLLDEKPDDPVAAKGLAAALLERDRWRDAKAIYERLLVTHPEDPSSEFNLAIVAEEFEKDLPKAAEHYQRYLDKGIDEPILLQSRARMYAQEILEKLEAAAAKTRPASRP
jgi:tetratricopeptide (TPR) repeat protein